MFLIIFFATIYDIYKHNEDNQPKFEKILDEQNCSIIENEIVENETRITVQENILSKVILSFSFYNNLKKIFEIQKSDDKLECLNGVRVLSLCWVILSHTYSNAILLASNLI
jgi:hypothetical protein